MTQKNPKQQKKGAKGGERDSLTFEKKVHGFWLGWCGASSCHVMPHGVW